MSQLVCSKCMKVFQSERDKCPECGAGSPYTYQIDSSDQYLKKEIPRVKEMRKKIGLQGLVKGLEYIIINTEPQNQKAAVKELLKYTGHRFEGAFEDAYYRTAVLAREGSADILVRTRKKGTPFTTFNLHVKSEHLPNTRLETFVFNVKDIEKYVSIQKSRGVAFLSDIHHTDDYSFVQTVPSRFTGNSLGFVQWKQRGSYSDPESTPLEWQMEKPEKDYLHNIYQLDHTATRVKAQDRDAAIIEFMEQTDYNFDFAIYVKAFNSITSVARLSEKDFAMVFTSGISPYMSEKESGPTEKFIHNYGPRVHHMAFHTENIEDTVNAIGEEGMDFLIELVGSPEEGLKQTFTTPSPSTLLVNEYIHRYGDFDGFFTKSNVTRLTEATGKQ